MTSKQEKLAAARRKLKEFQGKNKEGEVSKPKNKDASTPKVSKDYFYSSESITQNSPFISEFENSQNNHMTIHSNYPVQNILEKSTGDDFLERRSSNSSSHESNLPKLWSEYYSSNDKDKNPSDYANGLKEGGSEFYDINRKSSADFENMQGNDKMVLERNHENMDNFYDAVKAKSNDARQFFDHGMTGKNNLNDLIQPLQIELQNHAQTIKILVQQRNDAQTVLAETQQLLSKKTGEAEELKQQIAHLTSSTYNLSQKLKDAEDVIMKLKLEKENNLLKQDEIKSLADKFQIQLDTKEEEFQELKRKYEEKSSDCQKLVFSLHEAQKQLSLHQIQLQQYSPEGHSSLAVQISELQNENLNLKQRIVELEKKLEAEGAEKEESSQKFHIYAQQCNSQLSSLNSQIQSLKLENENLSQKNDILSKSLSDLESGKEPDKNLSSESFETEIADLHNQISALSEQNNQLSCSLKETKAECSRLENDLSRKDLELDKLLKEIKELEEENRNLANEAETPKANERLLATMESDKIAAAKAVSQNQKLKDQVVELEKAFIKLSEEKLELTNNLAHEKHKNAELQNLLKTPETKHEHGEDEHHHHHHHHHECQHEGESPEPLLNDSNEIEELRNIVRQLQDDKMELKARLNFYELNRNCSENETEKKQKEKCEHEHEHEDQQCEDTKLLLQKMEEKVRKTMNEIAVLDEEKEKLEHLVLQLQGETETIGEYITLYQKQRMLLRQRAQEKDIQLLQLSKDKEELKSKLVALDELVQRLIAEKENASIQPELKSPETNSSTKVSENTAGKIRALINEIGSTTLINDHSIAFEHCSCCSGRLIII